MHASYDIDPKKAMQCQLCHQYGAPLQYSPRDPDCIIDDKPMRWDLNESLRDKDFNDFTDHHQETLQTEGSTVEMQWKSVHLDKTNNHDRLEELIGMQFDGTALPHKRRPCTGNVQTLPGGVPGICEMRKDLFFLERDLEGTTCPVQTQNYEARQVLRAGKPFCYWAEAPQVPQPLLDEPE